MKANGQQFFRIDTRQFGKVCDLGMPAALAYIGLSVGRIGKSALTRWGATGMATHLLLGRREAQRAIRSLEDHGLVAPHAPTVRRIVESDSPFYAWLPHTVVFGASDERPPLHLLRETGDPLLLRLFVDLYAYQDLPGAGGLPPDVMHWAWTKHVVFESPSWCVAAFVAPLDLTSELPRHDAIVAPHEQQQSGSFLRRFARLISLGLVTETWRLYAGCGPTATPVCAFVPAEATRLQDSPAEVRIGAAAHQVVRAILRGQQEAWGEFCALQAESGDSFVFLFPLPAHTVAQATMRSTFRLRYRPHTQDTRDWATTLEEHATTWERRFSDVLVQWGDSAPAVHRGAAPAAVRGEQAAEAGGRI